MTQAWLSGVLLISLAFSSPASAKSDSLKDVRQEWKEAKYEESFSADEALALTHRCFAIFDDSMGNRRRFDSLTTILAIASGFSDNEALAEKKARAARIILTQFADYEQGLLRWIPTDLQMDLAKAPKETQGEIKAYLDTIRKKSRSRRVQAACLFAVADSVVMKSAEVEVTEEEQSDALSLLHEIKTKFGTAKDWQGEAYGTLADRGIFALTNLAIGQMAPEVDGKDLTGVPFKLSDYRGKVVLLDFWGNW